VIFRSHLGASTPAQVANRLDEPASVVVRLPRDQQVRPLVDASTSQSIGNALEFAARSAHALELRGAAAQLPPRQAAEARAAGEQVLDTFVADSKGSFMSAMHVASVFAGVTALIGAVISFSFLPRRREIASDAARTGTVREAERVVVS
jgi:hypothetical protein